jgi:hypothetical protein
VLPEQINNKINYFKRFDLGTQYKISPLCGLARGNPQWPRVLGLSSKSKISRVNFLVELKEQSTQCEKNRFVRIYNFELEKW